MLAVIQLRKSESPEVVGRLSSVTVHVNLQPYTVLRQSRRWSMGIKFETTQMWCASRYIILCMYYLHSMYSSHCSLLCLASRGFRTPPEPKAEVGPNLKPSCPLNTNQAVWLIGMGSIPCTVSQWRVRRSGLSLWVQQHTWLCSTNVKVSASPRQLPEMKATQAMSWTNENIYLLIFSVVYSITMHTLLIRQSRCCALNSENYFSINHPFCVRKILVHASCSV